MYVIVMPVSDVSVCEMKMGFVKEMEKKFKKDIRNCLLCLQNSGVASLYCSRGALSG